MKTHGEQIVATKKLGPFTYLGYAAGDAGNNLAFAMFGMFLLLYYTDVAGITAAAAGTLPRCPRMGRLRRYIRWADSRHDLDPLGQIPSVPFETATVTIRGRELAEKIKKINSTSDR